VLAASGWCMSGINARTLDSKANPGTLEVIEVHTLGVVLPLLLVGAAVLVCPLPTVSIPCN
jgi:hypothetical protein